MEALRAHYPLNLPRVHNQSDSKMTAGAGRSLLGRSPWPQQEGTSNNALFSSDLIRSPISALRLRATPRTGPTSLGLGVIADNVINIGRA